MLDMSNDEMIRISDAELCDLVAQYMAELAQDVPVGLDIGDAMEIDPIFNATTELYEPETPEGKQEESPAVDADMFDVIVDDFIAHSPKIQDIQQQAEASRWDAFRAQLNRAVEQSLARMPAREEAMEMVADAGTAFKRKIETVAGAVKRRCLNASRSEVFTVGTTLGAAALMGNSYALGRLNTARVIGAGINSTVVNGVGHALSLVFSRLRQPRVKHDEEAGSSNRDDLEAGSSNRQGPSL